MPNNFSVPGLLVSMEAENNMVEPYVCVEVGTADGECDLPSAATDTAIGVIQSSASAGGAVSVMLNGISKVVSGSAAITKGDRVHLTGTAGRIASNLEGTAATKYLGVALAAATEVGQIIPVILATPGVAEDGGAS